MKSLVDYFGCGHVIKQKDVVRFSVTKLYDIENKIIPFFKNYKISGNKELVSRSLAAKRQALRR